jgi:hypothetical protein
MPRLTKAALAALRTMAAKRTEALVERLLPHLGGGGLRRQVYIFGPALLLVLVLLRQELQRCGGLYAASDDSYIYLGYVKRVLTPPHELFSYNIGEHSAGTTGILYYYGLIVACFVVRLLTWSLPLDVSLRLGLYALNIGLFLVLAGYFAAVCRRLSAPTEAQIGPMSVFASAVLLSNPLFLSGVFGGQENPLCALLVVLLVHQILVAASTWRPAMVAAMLCASRPELTAVLWTIPAFVASRSALRAEGRTGAKIRPLAVGLLVGYATYALVLGALLMPCYLTTGRLFPSALGSRLTIAALGEPRLLLKGIVDVFQAAEIWKSDWALWNYVLVFSLVCLPPRRGASAALWTTLFVTTLLFVRAMLGLTWFGNNDRYVSYLWPLYALALTTEVYGLVSYALEGAGLLKSRARQALAGLAFLGLAFGLRVPAFLAMHAADVDEMNQVVVEPARWMRANLPPGSRVVMEPAGALRVFTDFYLVDAVGLTTTHPRIYPNYVAFMRANAVDYAFDYPGRIAELNDPSVFDSLNRWSPRPWHLSLGEIGVFRLRPEPPK